jgi:hypothetical protein
MAGILKHLSKFEFVLFVIFLLFSICLMTKTFRLDHAGNMQIATKAWSDFAATIPLIRSFSFGSNFPPEYPIFAGPPIKYHFVFYLLVGMLEKIGLPLSWALNLPSIIGFCTLLISIYYFGKIVFKSKTVGVISSILFLFNSSFSFLEFFKIHPLNWSVFTDIYHSQSFSSFGPYDGKLVSAFWNLNIYTNQRHLSIAYTAFLLILLYLYFKDIHTKKINMKTSITLGVLIGLFPFIHLAAFGMIGVMLISGIFLFPNIRKSVFIIGLIALILAIPQILYMGSTANGASLYHPGYLIDKLTLINFIKYWFLNLGLTSVLSIMGFLMSGKKERKVFIPFLLLFVIGNLFQLSPEIAANHKFFNLYIIGANAFSAYFLYRTWKINLLRPIVIVASFFLILSGILDLFPIFNDGYITVEDIPNNKIANYIKDNTPKNATFLNSSFLYNPASLAGRKIMMGWPYFAWSAGYDTDNRGKLITKIYESHSKSVTCGLLKQNSIDYFTVQDTSGDRDFPTIDLNYFISNFSTDYSYRGVSVINVAGNCP